MEHHSERVRTGRWRNSLAALGLVVAVAGCQTPSSAPGETTYGLFYSPVDHVEDLIASGDLAAASEVYDAEIEYFSEDPEETSEIASLLATELSDDLNPGIRTAQLALQNVVWPGEYITWSETKEAIETAEQAIADADEHLVLEADAYRPSSLVELETSLSDLKESITQQSTEMFGRYHIDWAESFFDAYPVKLDPETFFANRTWADQLVPLPVTGLHAVQRNYGSAVNEQMRRELAAAFFAASLKMSSTKEGSASRTVLKTVLEAKKAGFDLDPLPPSDVQVINATGRSPAQKFAADFAVEVESDLPIKLTRAAPLTALEKSKIDGARTVILIDAVSAVADRVVREIETVESEYRSGTRTEQNPAYVDAFNAVQIAQLEVQSAQIQKAGIDAQYCYGAGCLGKAVSQIAAGVTLGKRRDELNAAIARMNSVPKTIERPVYTSYTFNKAHIDATKTSDIVYYVIDMSEGVYHRGSMKLSERASFTVPYSVHDKERSPYTKLANTNEESEVVDFEDKKVEVVVSDVIEHFLRSPTSALALPASEVLASDISMQRERVASTAKRIEYAALPKKDDPRFDSTVIITSPSGSGGSGFFVTSDTVITNYHVVDDAKFVEVKMFKDEQTFGKVVAYDIRRDLALIKVQARGTPVSFFKGPELPLGETVEAIGHPAGFEFSITRGVISGTRTIPSKHAPGATAVQVVQTDTPINPGNSGGPLFLGGEVIGVNVQKLAATEFEGIGFAVHYGEVVDFLMSNGIQPYVGS